MSVQIMNKIEEIFKEEFNKNHTASNEDKVSFKQIAYRAMKEFGKICFEAGRQASYVAAEQYIEESLENNKLQHQTYEDFLKEMKDEID